VHCAGALRSTLDGVDRTKRIILSIVLATVALTVVLVLYLRRAPAPPPVPPAPVSEPEPGSAQPPTLVEAGTENVGGPPTALRDWVAPEVLAAQEAARLAEELRTKSREAFARGIAAQKTGDHAAAITAYREALTIDAGMAGAWTNLALALDATGNSAEGLEAARKAVSLPAMKDAKRRAHAMHTVGHLALKTGARDEAVAAFEEALRADARQAAAALELAALWNSEEKPEKALAALVVAQEAGAESAAVYTALAIHWWNAGDITKAQSNANDALRINPNEIEAKAVLGWCCLAQKRWGDAAQRIDEVVRARPNDADLQAALGFAYDKLGRHQDAIAAFDRAIELAPAHPSAHAQRGVALEAVGEVQRARLAYEIAAKSGSSESVAASQMKLAVVAYKDKRWADARTLAEAAIAADPKSVQARYVLGLACFALGDRTCAGEQEYQLTLLDPERAADLRKLISEE
jgi:tetratricopeptide (TPR) repeat protein